MTFAARKLGLPPGTIISISNDNEPIRISYIRYAEDFIEEKKCSSVDEVFQFHKNNQIVWINVEGTSDLTLFEKLVEQFQIDRLVVEDILDPETRPKFESFDTYSFTVGKMLYQEPKYKYTIEEHISFLLIDNLLFTFQFKHGDVFDKVRERIRTADGKIRTRKTDYLLYALLDIMVDNYFVVMDALEENIIKTEDSILSDPDKNDIGAIRRMKKESMILRKAIVPLKDAILLMRYNEAKVFEKRTHKYLGELQEHLQNCVENVEYLRDMANELMDIYISTSNTKLGNITKVLTIVSAVFIPLNSLAGIYGMNFDIIPFKTHPYGFHITIFSMILIAITLFLYFRFKKWF